nr:unnamed protein product [Callosobruchus analis]
MQAQTKLLTKEASD